MNEQLRATADLLLARELFAVTADPPGPDGFVEPPGFPWAPDDDIDPRSEGALLALEALGTLSAQDAERWRLRFRIAAAEWAAGPPAEPGRARLAERHLDRLRRALDEASGKERGATRRRIDAAASLYVYTGSTQPELGGEEDYAEGHGWYGFVPTGGDERVVPAELVRHDGLCLVSAVLQTHSFALRWHAVVDGPLDDDGLEQFRGFEAEDDAGTEYGPVEPGGASWSESEGPQVVTGSSWCFTPVPEAASVLRLRRGAAEWRVPLG